MSSKKTFIPQLSVEKTPVNTRAFGHNFVLTAALPHVKHDTGERTGTDYEIVCVDYDFEKVKVVVDGPQTIPDDVVAKGHPRVAIDGMTASVYHIGTSVGLSIKANAISIVK